MARFREDARLTDTVQRGFSIDPDRLSPSSGEHSASAFEGFILILSLGQSAESAMLITSLLRDVIRQQSTEIEAWITATAK